MSTFVIESKPRKMTTGVNWRIDVLGPDGPAKDRLEEAIKGLKNHPAKVARQSLTDILALIDQFKYQIRHVEHTAGDGEMESWLFVVQN